MVFHGFSWFSPTKKKNVFCKCTQEKSIAVSKGTSEDSEKPFHYIWAAPTKKLLFAWKLKIDNLKIVATLTGTILGKTFSHSFPIFFQHFPNFPIFFQFSLIFPKIFFRKIRKIIVENWKKWKNVFPNTVPDFCALIHFKVHIYYANIDILCTRCAL